MNLVELREEGGHLRLEGVDPCLDRGDRAFTSGDVGRDLRVEHSVACRDLGLRLVANPLDLVLLPAGDGLEVGIRELVQLRGALLGFGADPCRALGDSGAQLSQRIVARLLGDLAHRVHQALEERHRGLSGRVMHRWG